MKLEMIRILYFSWIREGVGTSEEKLETKSENVKELINELKLKNEKYNSVFSKLDNIRVAVDQKLVNFETSIKNAEEVAFFPPMTGG
jgi:molybdopterin synthase sulfur carrier subunit